MHKFWNVFLMQTPLRRDINGQLNLDLPLIVTNVYSACLAAIYNESSENAVLSIGFWWTSNEVEKQRFMTMATSFSLTTFECDFQKSVLLCGIQLNFLHCLHNTWKLANSSFGCTTLTIIFFCCDQLLPAHFILTNLIVVCVFWDYYLFWLFAIWICVCSIYTYDLQVECIQFWQQKGYKKDDNR